MEDATVIRIDYPPKRAQGLVFYMLSVFTALRHVSRIPLTPRHSQMYLSLCPHRHLWNTPCIKPPANTLNISKYARKRYNLHPHREYLPDH